MLELDGNSRKESNGIATPLINMYCLLSFQVGQYIYSVNDELVVDLDHKELAHIIVNTDGYMNMVVMEHIHDQPMG